MDMDGGFSMKVGSQAADTQMKAKQAAQLEKAGQQMKAKAKELKAQEATNLQPKVQNNSGKLNLTA
jgi:hypothetical protein